MTRLGLAGVTVLALSVFAIYAAYLVSKVDDVDPPVLITVPGSGEAQPFGVGQQAVDFALADMMGKTVRLSDYAGRPVWINVWASWCAPCRAEMPDIETVYRESQATADTGPSSNGRLALLAISLGEEPAVAQRYLESAHYQLPVLVDPAFAMTQRYRITGLPTHYFIGRDGVIRDLAVGGLKPSGMRARLAKIV